MPRIIPFYFCAVVVFLAGSAHADEQWQVSSGQSHVSFVLHSTFHDVTGKVQALSGSLDQQLQSAKGFVDIDVSGMTTDNKERDKNMYEMFAVTRHPKIHVLFDQVDMSHMFDHPDGKIMFSGRMTIQDITHPLVLWSKARRAGNALVCEGRMNIHLRDYGLHPPSVLSFIRVKDEVSVQYVIVFVKGEQYAHR